MSTAAVEHGLRTIPLSSINPNPDNPRKHYDEAGLKELAASIREHGLWEPVVVRPDPIKPTAFELIIGERRWRASKLAGKSDILAMVRPLSDRQALEVMIIENLQREDLNPLEEGAGYQSLLDAGSDGGAPAHTITTLAVKIGKSESYIYARLKLMQLIAAAREALTKGRISPGHAVLIARLQPGDQLKALAACFDRWGGDLDKDLIAETAKLDDLVEDDIPLIPEKELRVWIQDNVNLKLKGVPWDLTDPNLVAEAGACTTCPKRSVSNPSLFAELAIKGEDTCFDGECFRSKRTAFVKLQLKLDKDKQQDAARAQKVAGIEPGEKQVEPEQLRQITHQPSYTAPKPDQKVLRKGQWLEAKKGSCSSVEKAIVVKGEDAGEFLTICANSSCKVHKHNLQAAPSSTKTKATKVDQAEIERQEKIDEAWQTHAQQMLAEKVDGADRAALIVFVEFVREQGWINDLPARKKFLELPLQKAWSLLAQYVLRDELANDGLDSLVLIAFAEAKKLDLSKLEKDFKAKQEELTKPAQTPAKGVSKAKAKGRSGSPTSAR